MILDRLIPARVVPQPADADRIGDQMVENIHRAGMREAEIVAGVEQLALLGVSAAQIAKRTGHRRADVDHALTVGQSAAARAASPDRGRPTATAPTRPASGLDGPYRVTAVVDGATSLSVMVPAGVAPSGPTSHIW